LRQKGISGKRPTREKAYEYYSLAWRKTEKAYPSEIEKPVHIQHPHPTTPPAICQAFPSHHFGCIKEKVYYSFNNSENALRVLTAGNRPGILGAQWKAGQAITEAKQFKSHERHEGGRSSRPVQPCVPPSCAVAWSKTI
jgi:hypothetical protein